MEGNQMKMREALEFSERELLAATKSAYYKDVVYLVGCMLAVARICRAALSAPPRNCDVGTAEEQFKRYLAFCHSESRGCEHCPAKKTRFRGTSNCDLAWAQMPYEAEEGGAK